MFNILKLEQDRGFCGLNPKGQQHHFDTATAYRLLWLRCWPDVKALSLSHQNNFFKGKKKTFEMVIISLMLTR